MAVTAAAVTGAVHLVRCGVPPPPAPHRPAPATAITRVFSPRTVQKPGKRRGQVGRS